MKTLISGTLALIIGVPCMGFFLPSLGNVLAGTLPLLLILGGGLAIYLGIDEIRAEKESLISDFPEPGPCMVSNPAATGAPTEEIQIETQAAEQTTVKTEIPGQAQAQKEPDKDFPGLTGNTDSLVFHRLDCNFAQSPKCTQAFASPQEAMDLGYKPCKVCSP